MSNPIISVEGLSKKYRIHHKAESARSATLRETISLTGRSWIANLGRGEKTPAPSKSTAEDFWALRDVCFDVKRGEVLGIVGRNGAGKSTLLKVLSRITEPSEGRVRIDGKVASLLEVGTGFHPELTGRENVFLNGAILGMSRAEVKSKFDEIVEFAGVERFLDTPVKRYSSGMYVRLAFAVAAHLEPEILIVDEVLAVGDAEFQKKCLGKMQDVASIGGRTVLFVSHSIPAVARLCGTACWLEGGRLRQVGETAQVLSAYIESGAQPSSVWVRPADKKAGRAYVERIEVLSKDIESSEPLTTTDPIQIGLTLSSDVASLKCQIALRVTTADGIPVFTTASTDTTLELTSLREGLNTFTLTIPSGLLPAGQYNILCGVLIPGVELMDVVSDNIGFELHEGLNHATHFGDGRLGVVTPVIEWRGI